MLTKKSVVRIANQPMRYDDNTLFSQLFPPQPSQHYPSFHLFLKKKYPDIQKGKTYPEQ